MAVRERAVDRGTRLGMEAASTFQREIRQARSVAGLSQDRAARVAGISGSEWSRIETGHVAPRDWILAARMAAVVGLDLRLRLYGGPDPVRDAGQVRLLKRMVGRLGDDWRWRHEVLLPGDREQRAWDAVGSHRLTGLRLNVEAETRLVDVQAVIRRWHAKRLTDPGPRFVALVGDTRTNRSAISAARVLLRAELAVTGAAALDALRRGVDPGGDVLLVL